MTFTAKADATAWLAKAEGDIARSTWIAPSAGKVTFAEVADRWLASNPSKRKSTVEVDRRIISAHLVPAFGARRVDKITKAEVQSVVDGWATTLAPSTVGRIASALRAIFSWAIDAEIVAKNPATDVRLPHVALVDRPTLPAADLERLAKAMGDEAPFMWVGAIGGLRWAEVAGLTVDNLDLLAGTVAVAHQLGRDLELGPPKSQAGRRCLAIPAWLADDLAGHLARRNLTAADAGALVFVAPEGGPIRYRNWLKRVWHPACTTAGLPGLRFHDQRSMSATALVAAGADVRTAQTRLGHSSPAVTLGIYARATVEADRRAAEAVGHALRTDRARSEHAAR
jgi:integrase